MYTKTIKFPRGYLWNSSVEGESNKEAFCFPGQCFLHTLFLENKEKNSEKKITEKCFSYQLKGWGHNCLMSKFGPFFIFGQICLIFGM